MQENNFEDKMRQKMDDLTLSPSAEVWPKVAVQIQKKDKGRRVLLVLFFTGLLLGGAGFYFWNESAKNNSEMLVTTSKQQDQNKFTTNTKTASTDKNSMPVLSNEKPETIANAGKKTSATSTVVTNKSAENQSLVVNDKIIKPSALQSNDQFVHQSLAKKSRLKYANKAKTKMHIGNVNAADDIGDVDNASGIDSYNLINYYPAIILTERFNKSSVGIHSLSSLESKKITPVNPVFEKKSGDKKDNKNMASPKWQIGISASGGISFVNNNLFGSTAKSFDAAIPNSGVGSNPGQPDTIVQAVPLKSNIGFKAGVAVARKLSPKINIVSGLTYVFYSAKFNEGYNFSTSPLYSSNIRIIRKDHNNIFHFIELPIGIQWRLTNKKALPVYLETGLSLSRLIGSTALQFNNSTGFYKDNNLLNKTQVSLSAKLLFGLGKNWLVGPAVSYHLSNVANAGYYENKQYSYFGIQLQHHLFNK